MNLFDAKNETLPQPELRQLQLERLQALLARLRRNVRRHRETAGEARVDSLEELARLPATRPEDLLASFPYGMFALPLREVIRLHSIIGPEGRQLVTGHTQNDLARWGRLVARQFVAAGVTANDVVQICLGGAASGSASGYALGAQAIEASVIAEEPLHIDYQVAMLQNYRPTILVTTPSNARDLARLLDQKRIDPQSLHLRAILLSRPVPAAERAELEAGLFAKVRCNFGVMEVLDPGMCVECAEGRFHVNEDQFLVEVENGELLVTTLAREAMPLLRYTTRVSCEIHRDKCPCGRTGAVLLPGRRLDQQLCIREMPVYESQMREVLSHTRAAGQRVRLGHTDRAVLVAIEVTEAVFDDRMRTLETVGLEVQSEFLARLGLEAKVTFVSPGGGSAA